MVHIEAPRTPEYHGGVPTTGGQREEEHGVVTMFILKGEHYQRRFLQVLVKVSSPGGEMFQIQLLGLSLSTTSGNSVPLCLKGR